jgi:hypothetical protein
MLSQDDVAILTMADMRIDARAKPKYIITQ